MIKKSIAFFLVLLLAVCTSCAKPAPKAPVRKPQINGALGEISLHTSGISSQEARAVEASYTQEKAPTYRTIESFYQAIYMSAGSIDEGALGDLFVSSTGKRVIPRLSEFSLGKVAEKLESVDDGILTVDPMVFYRTGEGFFAICGAQFAVTGELEGGSHILIESKGTFYLAKKNGKWLIFDCDLQQSADTGKKGSKGKVKSDG